MKKNKESKWKFILWVVSLVVIGILGMPGIPVDQIDDK